MPASTLTIVKVIDLRHLSKSRACVGGLGVPMFISRDAAPIRAMSAYGVRDRVRGRGRDRVRGRGGDRVRG